MDFVELWQTYWPEWTPGILRAGFCLTGVLFLVLLYLFQRGKLTGQQIVAAMLLAGYLICVFASTVFGREEQETYHFQLELFWSYRAVFQWHDREMAKEILLNCVMLLPYGFLFPIAVGSRKWVQTIFTGAACSVTIEILQLVLKRGLFEWDDMIHNTLGVILGYALYCLCFRKNRVLSEKGK